MPKTVAPERMLEQLLARLLAKRVTVAVDAT